MTLTYYVYSDIVQDISLVSNDLAEKKTCGFIPWDAAINTFIFGKWYPLVM
jgi:hypothetical protein